MFSFLLDAVLVGLDHLLDHLAADGTGLTAGQVTVVTVLQVNADFSGCTFYILGTLKPHEYWVLKTACGCLFYILKV